MNNLQKIRKSKRLSQERLAELAGISVDMIRAIEQGRSDTTMEKAKRIAIALDCDICEIWL